MEGTIGEIRLFASNFSPRSWAYCDGRLIAIASNTALFSILGTNFGGDGKTTFALPNLKGRTAIGAGQGPGTSNYALGQAGGVETETMTVAQMPAHTHMIGGSISTDPINLLASNADADTNEISATVFPAITGGNALYDAPTANTFMAPLSVSLSVTNQQVSSIGAGIPFSIVTPYLGLNYIICLYGIFPARD